jgi:hypothetical protein
VRSRRAALKDYALRREEYANANWRFPAGSNPCDHRVQTVNVPVGGGSIFEVRLREPGDYPFGSHAFADATKGAVGVLRAEAGANP